MILGTFDQNDLSDEQRTRLTTLATEARGDILKMTTLAASGHAAPAETLASRHLCAFALVQLLFLG